MSLGVVARLADALILPRAVLWAEPDPDSHTPTADPDDAGDAAAVGALLAETEVLTAVEALTDALGWTIRRTKGDVAIRRRETATDPRQLQALLKHHHARRSLTLTEAHLLYDIHHDHTEQHITGNNDGVALARLHNAGLIQDRDQLDLADDVRVSLMLL